MNYALCAALAFLATTQTPANADEPRQWNIGLAATVDQSPFVGGDIADSPIIDNSTVWGGYAGAAYRW